MAMLGFLHAWQLSWFRLNYKVLHYWEFVGELNTFQVIFPSFSWTFLVALPQAALVKVVPNSHMCGWCSHCVYKSFRTQEALSLTGCVRDSVFPRAATKALLIHNASESSLHADRRMEGLGPQSPLTVLKDSALYLLWWLPPKLLGEQRKRVSV